MKKIVITITATLIFNFAIAGEMSECDKLKSAREYLAENFLNPVNYSFYRSLEEGLSNAKDKPLSYILKSKAQTLEVMFKNTNSNILAQEKEAKSRIIKLLFEESECRSREEAK